MRLWLVYSEGPLKREPVSKYFPFKYGNIAAWDGGWENQAQVARFGRMLDNYWRADDRVGLAVSNGFPGLTIARSLLEKKIRFPGIFKSYFTALELFFRSKINLNPGASSVSSSGPPGCVIVIQHLLWLCKS